MQRNKKLENIIFLLLISLLIPFQAVYPQKYLTSKQYYYPEVDDPFFKRGNDIEVTANHILILENPKHHILEFEINKEEKIEFKGFFVSKGEGPGQAVLPIEMSIWENKVAVIDRNTISFFSNKGEYLNEFRIFTGKISFVYTVDKIYLANTNPNSPFLIDVYSTGGKKLFQFGEDLIKINYKIHQKKVRYGFVKSVLYMGKLVADRNLIYYFNKRFAKVFVFDLHGKKINEKSIVPIFDKKSAEEKLKHNTKLLKEGIKLDKNNAVVTPTFFRDVYLCNNKIYILNSLQESRASSNIKIRVLDKNSLELTTILLIKKTSDNDRISSIAVQEVNGKPIIFAAMNIKDGSVLAKFME